MGRRATLAAFAPLVALAAALAAALDACDGASIPHPPGSPPHALDRRIVILPPWDGCLPGPPSAAVAYLGVAGHQRAACYAPDGTNCQWFPTFEDCAQAFHTLPDITNETALICGEEHLAAFGDDGSQGWCSQVPQTPPRYACVGDVQTPVMLYGDNADPSCLLNEAGTACVWPAPGEDCATAGQYAHFKSPSLQCGSAKMVSLLGDNGYQQANTWCCDAFVWTHTQGLLPSPVAGFACPISIPTIGGGLLPFGSLDTVAAEVCNAMAAPILITRWSIGGGYIPTDRQILGMNECGAHATDGFLIDNGVVTLVYRLGGGGTWDLAFLAVARNPAIGKPEFLLGNSVTAPSVAGQCTAAIRSYSDALTYPGGDPNSITGGTWAPAPGDVVVYNVPGLDVMVERSEDVGTSKWFRVTVENLASNFTIVVPGAQERGAAATEGQPPAPRTPYRPGAQPNGVGEYQDPAVCAAWLADKIATVTDPWTPNPVVSHEMVTIPL